MIPNKFCPFRITDCGLTEKMDARFVALEYSVEFLKKVTSEQGTLIAVIKKSVEDMLASWMKKQGISPDEEDTDTSSKNRLKDEADDELETTCSWRQKSKNPSTEEFSTALLRRFGGWNGRGTVFEKLAALRQTGSVEDYVQEFELLVVQASATLEEQLLGYFLAGLRQDIRAQVQPHDSNDLTRAMEVARDIEEAMKEVPMRSSPRLNPLSSGGALYPGLPTTTMDLARSQVDNKKQFQLDFDKIKSGEDTRTTLMIKNIPNKYTTEMLLAAIDENHRGTYDFFYLPIDFKTECNVGYAFINMLSPSLIIPFYKAFNGKKWENFKSEKVASLAYARIQGKTALVSHFQNSSSIYKRGRPILFHSEDPEAGNQFPVDHTRASSLQQYKYRSDFFLP